MADLLVRGIDDSLVARLRKRAMVNGVSVAAEHRAILAAALRGPKKRSFAQFLSAMPPVGQDADFARVQDKVSPNDVFD
jgi:antitoxin FitA